MWAPMFADPDGGQSYSALCVLLCLGVYHRASYSLAHGMQLVSNRG